MSRDAEALRWKRWVDSSAEADSWLLVAGSGLLHGFCYDLVRATLVFVFCFMEWHFFTLSLEL